MELDKFGRKYKINVNKGYILVYANEEDLLSSLFAMHILYKEACYLKKHKAEMFCVEDSNISKAVKKFLLIGEELNDAEIIRDFDGWSWNNNIKDTENSEYNLIFQNMVFLLGRKILQENFDYSIKENFEKYEVNTENLSKLNKEDLIIINNVTEEKENRTLEQIYEQSIIKSFEKVYTKERCADIVKQIYIAVITLEAIKNEEIREKIEREAEIREEEEKIINNTTEFLNKITQENQQITADIKLIDKTINDKEKLKQEYENRNSLLENKDKIFSISHLAETLEKERNERLQELKHKNKILEPAGYIQEKERVSKELYFYSRIRECMQNTNEKNKQLMDTQKEFLKCFLVHIEQADSRIEILKLIYNLRYYLLLPVNEDTKIKDIPELKEDIKNIINRLIDKAIDKKVIENISNSESLCYSILKYIFETNVIELEKVQIKIAKNKEEKNIAVTIYDEKKTEKVYNIEAENINLLNVKLNKKIPLFL